MSVMSDIAAGADVLSNFLNFGLQASANDFNQKMSINQFDYQKDLQNKIFEREDTAYQRRVADMEAAGLNKYAINGGAGAGSVVSTNAPHADAPQLKLMHLDAMNSLAQIENQKVQTENLRLANKNLKVDNKIKTEMAENTTYMNQIRRKMAYGQWLYDIGYRGLKYDEKKGEFSWDTSSLNGHHTENITSLDKAFGQREYISDLYDENIDLKEKDNKSYGFRRIIDAVKAAGSLK